MVKLGIAGDAAQQILVRLIAANGGCQISGGQTRDLAAVVTVETIRRRLGPVQIGGQFGRLRTAIEIAQVPLRQDSKIHLIFSLKHRLSRNGTGCRVSR